MHKRHRVSGKERKKVRDKGKPYHNTWESQKACEHFRWEFSIVVNRNCRTASWASDQIEARHFRNKASLSAIQDRTALTCSAVQERQLPQVGQCKSKCSSVSLYCPQAGTKGSGRVHAGEGDILTNPLHNLHKRDFLWLIIREKQQTQMLLQNNRNFSRSWTLYLMPMLLPPYAFYACRSSEFFFIRFHCVLTLLMLVFFASKVYYCSPSFAATIKIDCAFAIAQQSLTKQRRYFLIKYVLLLSFLKTLLL